MKYIDFSTVSTTVSAPFTSGVANYYQAAYKEAIGKLAIPIIGSQYNNTDYFILEGCKNTGTGSSYIISAGSIFHNGEVYEVDAATFTAAGTAVGTITLVPDPIAGNGNPLTFSDGTLVNALINKKILFANGTSGSGSVDFSDLKPVGMEDRHIVGATGEPAFQNSWGNVGGSVAQVSFRKDFSKKIIYLEGEIIKSGPSLLAGVPSVFWTFPTDFITAKDRYFSVNSDVGDYPVIITIRTDGNISAVSNTTVSSGINLTLDGIYYFTD